MARPKRRNNKNYRQLRSTMPQHQTGMAPIPRTEDFSYHADASPFQPLNMFFNRSHNPRYTAIPEMAGERHPSLDDPVPPGVSPYFSANRDYDNNSNNNILIDIQTENNIRQQQHSNGGSSNTPPTTGTTVHNSTHSRLGSTLNVYNSDVDTASRGGSIEEDVCFPPADAKDEKGGIDFEALEEYIIEERRALAANDAQQNARRRRLSNMGGFGDGKRYGSFYGDRMKHLEGEDAETYRITYYSPFEPSTIHARSISEVPSNGEKLSDMLKKGCFWIDILCPTDNEMKALSKIFHIHPLTAEDITMEEPREKCEVFKNYYFICFRSFEQDQLSLTYMQPLGMYILIMKEGILTFHFRPMPHPHSVRKRIKQLKDYIRVTPDWICYAILDDITDSFAPLIRAIEFEVDSIDELVLILKESEQSDMLRRIGYCRKRMMSLLRLLVSKADVLKTIVKRGETQAIDGTRPAFSNEVALYLGDVQDHIITMLQSLNHYEKISSRSHSNYLAQISIEMTQTNNEINDVLSKLTALGSVLVPMNLVTGLWGMNVQVPGQYQEDLTWFTCIMVSILTFCVASTLLMRYYNIV